MKAAGGSLTDLHHKPTDSLHLIKHTYNDNNNDPNIRKTLPVEKSRWGRQGGIIRTLTRILTKREEEDEEFDLESIRGK